MRFRSGIIRFGSVWHFFKHFLFIIFNTSKVQIFCTKIYLSRATVICRDFHFLIIHSVYNICKVCLFLLESVCVFPLLVAVAAAQSVPEILFANVMHFIAFTAFKTWLFIIFYSTKKRNEKSTPLLHFIQVLMYFAHLTSHWENFRGDYVSLTEELKLSPKLSDET